MVGATLAQIGFQITETQIEEKRYSPTTGEQLESKFTTAVEPITLGNRTFSYEEFCELINGDFNENELRLISSGWCYGGFNGVENGTVIGKVLQSIPKYAGVETIKDTLDHEKIKEQLNKSFGYTGEVFMYLVEHYY